ncbi:hypothetical protein E5288_WYG021619 [Bos mutus]|uniref:Uncharacterized protein n=1 Tax=Bos mutus TaxID=72004 RepID=A0A6B0S0K7_9CETA|nr:hypothetical protein [Bos mutus]
MDGHSEEKNPDSPVRTLLPVIANVLLSKASGENSSRSSGFYYQAPKGVFFIHLFFPGPRSLCHCAQVSWHWKNLTELDQLWMLKCLWFNWYINVSPTPCEQGVWKKHYIQMVKELHVTKPKFLLCEKSLHPEQYDM